LETVKQKKQPKQKKRRWPWLKMLSLLTFALALTSLWVLWVMNKEARRLGIFAREEPGVSQAKPGASSPVEEIEREDKKALENILKKRSGR
jgi:type VI protein secretion system component VasK